MTVGAGEPADAAEMQLAYQALRRALETCGDGTVQTATVSVYIRPDGSATVTSVVPDEAPRACAERVVAAQRFPTSEGEVLQVRVVFENHVEPQQQGLTRDMVRSKMTALAKDLRACGDGFTGRATITAKVAPDGRVTDVSTRPADAPGACLRDVVRRAKFPSSTTGGSFSWPVTYPAAESDARAERLMHETLISHMAALRKCGGDFTGEATITGHIGADGRLVRISVFPQQAPLTCIREVVSGLTFPDETKGISLHWRVPFSSEP
ncbi:MAG TPA: hypothetical protein VK427_26090 [Kofleriaceae bacterium]|nr:hypothetical protein [Kofleriaceae bacterium]